MSTTATGPVTTPVTAAPGAAGGSGDDALSLPFDVVVVGAGVNGVGIARDAALRGLRVALLEQDDICSGVSAWSGRLVHGGLRYLEHYDFALVRESLRERETLFRLAPHLVKPVRLLMPFYEHNKRPAWLIRVGMVLYDVLSFDKKSQSHEVLGRDDLRRRFTGIGPDGLGGAAVFTDGQLEHAERLCVELAVAAAGDGAVIRTGTRVEDVLTEHGRVRGVRVRDTATGAVRDVLAPVVLNVAGPWIDRVFDPASWAGQPRLNGGTKGSHLVVDPFPGAPSDVVYYESRRDGRLVLVIPWLGRYLIGTTDIRYDEEPGSARCDADEMQYILDEVNSLVPEAGLTTDDVLYTYSGVRPLPYAPGVPESKVPRSHVLHDHGPGLKGLVTVVGGKLTTYRSLAEDAVDDVLRRLGRPAVPCPTRTLPFPGATTDGAGVRSALVRAGLPARSAERLVAVYGRRALDVLASAGGDPELLAVVHEPSGAIGAELLFAVRHELARGLADVMARRTLLAFEPDHGLPQLDHLVALLGDRLGWDAARRDAEAADYRGWLDHLAVPAPVPAPAGAAATAAAAAA